MKGFATMVEYTAPVFWLFFLMTTLSIVVLRWKEPQTKRPFAVPGYPITPLLFCAVCIYMLISSIQYTGTGALAGVAVFVAGIPFLVMSKRSIRKEV
jgi:amino acid transporter